MLTLILLSNCILGEADPRIQEKSGIKNYNVKLVLNFGKNENEAMDKSEESEKKKKMMEFIDIGIVYDEGRKCAMKGLKIIYFKT